MYSNNKEICEIYGEGCGYSIKQSGCICDGKIVAKNITAVIFPGGVTYTTFQQQGISNESVDEVFTQVFSQ